MTDVTTNRHGFDALPEKHAYLHVGREVWYQSSPHHRHKGVVIGRPHQLLSGEWVIPVGELEPPVQKSAGDGRTSRAASVGRLSPRMTDAHMCQLYRAMLTMLCDAIEREGREGDGIADYAWDAYHGARILAGQVGAATDGDAALSGVRQAAIAAGVELERGIEPFPREAS